MLTKSNIYSQNSCVTKDHFRDSEKMRCAECNRRTEGVKITTFPRLPRILIVQLSRFDNQMNKVNTATPIPNRLECFCSTCDEMPKGTRNEDHGYRLYGVIVHLGTTPNTGHYIAYVRSIEDNLKCHESDSCCRMKLNSMDQDRYSDNGTKWYICDDDKISVISRFEFDEKIKSEASIKTPYILFYARNDLIAENAQLVDI